MPQTAAGQRGSAHKRARVCDIVYLLCVCVFVACVTLTRDEGNEQQLDEVAGVELLKAANLRLQLVWRV